MKYNISISDIYLRLKYILKWYNNKKKGAKHDLSAKSTAYGTACFIADPAGRQLWVPDQPADETGFANERFYAVSGFAQAVRAAVRQCV